MSGALPVPRGRPLLLDRFSRDAPQGGVEGTCAEDATPPQVTDAEGVLSIDHAALRITIPAKPGRGRAGISYGPFPARPGWPSPS